MWDSFFEQVKKENSQYITWTLVFVGWAVTISVAAWQEMKNKARDKITLSRDIVNRISELEDRSIAFWLSPPSVAAEIELYKLTRDLKTITTIGMKIAENEVTYPKDDFVALRKAISLYDRTIIAESPTGFRVATIRDCCSTIRKIYQ